MRCRHEPAHDATPDEVFEMLPDRAFRERVDIGHEAGRAWLKGER